MTTTLYGHAIPITFLHIADHTYVTSSDGRRWHCWGRDEGGEVICSGAGNSDIAQCDSTPDSHADIEYGATGVCHQTANRILFPASVNVRKARMSSVTYKAYGVLGKDHWYDSPGYCPKFLAKAAACARSHKDVAGSPFAAAGAGDSGSVDEEKQASFMREIVDLHAPAIESFHMVLKREVPARDDSDLKADISAGELRTMVKYFLRDGYDSTKVAQLVDVRAALHERMKDASAAILSADGSPESLAEKINAEIIRMQVEMKEVLGEDDFTEFFGHSDTDVLAVDPELLAASMNR
ncbi:MAG: hypothetical protein OEV49_16660 [candidate division Zixibacteria bacterium]|nr:hypothetical protein [candidate division Zixibacteria bacterium]MDH3938829.1 hypothetical protein [candidate division Zixibacteria bacterium]MDH4032403.1 hypothetical protein [candidate division Zixibacteria bacterium]